MSLSRWAALVASDTGIQIARVCQFYGLDPAIYLHDPEDGPIDRYEQLALAEALMLRLQVWERQQEEAQQDEHNRKQAIATSQAAPGSQERVQPPTVEEVIAMRGR